LSVLVVVATVAPACFASWMANVPTPPEPAWMSTFCPGFRFALSISACHAVKPTRGMEAASAMVRAAGFIATSSSLIAMNSANAPIRPSAGRA
jgi:hypothetical protein